MSLISLADGGPTGRPDDTPAAPPGGAAGVAVSFAVVVPVFNEAGVIGGVLDTLERFARGHPHIAFVVVDDGSGDGTARLLDDRLGRATSGGLRCVLLGRNVGKGRAVRAGLTYCFAAFRAAHVGFLDGDLAYDPAELLALEAALATHDVAIGKRSRAAAATGYAWRPALGRAFNLLVRVLLGLPHRDTQAGLKAFRADAAEALFSRQRLGGMAFDAELLYLARKLGLTVAEVPARLDPRHVYTTAVPKLARRSAQLVAGILGVRANDLLGRYD